MMIAIGVGLAAVGSGLLLASVLVVTHAAPYERFPIATNPKVRRGWNITLRVAGLLLAMLGTMQFLTPEIRYWSPAVLVAALVPATVAIIAHNRRVARTHRFVDASS